MAKSGVNTSSLRELKFENAGTWPLLPKVLAFALAAALGALIVYYLMIEPKLKDVNTVRDNISSVEKEIVTLEQTVKRFEGQQEKAIELAYALEEASKILPLQQEQPQLIDDIAENALAASLDLLEFRPSVEVAQEQFYELPISLRFSGSYDAVADFMAKVSSMERLVIPASLRLEKSGSDDLTGNLVLKTFRFRDSAVSVEEVGA